MNLFILWIDDDDDDDDDEIAYFSVHCKPEACSLVYSTKNHKLV